jgi:hypothetical protein
MKALTIMLMEPLPKYLPLNLSHSIQSAFKYLHINFKWIVKLLSLIPIEFLFLRIWLMKLLNLFDICSFGNPIKRKLL